MLSALASQHRKLCPVMGSSYVRLFSASTTSARFPQLRHMQIIGFEITGNTYLNVKNLSSPVQTFSAFASIASSPGPH